MVQTGSGFTYGYAKQTGTANYAFISQISGEESRGAIQRLGDDNAASVTQTLWWNQADIAQTGNLNNASIAQTGVTTYTPSNTAYITQAGNGFSASIPRPALATTAGSTSTEGCPQPRFHRHTFLTKTSPDRKVCLDPA